MMIETELNSFKNWNSFLIYGFSFSEKSLLKTTSRQMLSKEFQYLILHFTVIIGNMLKTEIMVLWHFHYGIIRFPVHFHNQLGTGISVQRYTTSILTFYSENPIVNEWVSAQRYPLWSSKVALVIASHFGTGRWYGRWHDDQVQSFILCAT